jgi:hypothetical protein
VPARTLRLIRASERSWLRAAPLSAAAGACSGETSKGIARLEQGLDGLRKMGLWFRMTGHLCLLAQSLLSARRYIEGLEQVARAFDFASETGEQFLPVATASGASGAHAARKWDGK